MANEKKEKKETCGLNCYYPYIALIALFCIFGGIIYQINNDVSHINSKIFTLEQNLADFKSALPKSASVKIYYASNCTVCSNFSDMLSYLQRNGVVYDLIDVLENKTAADYVRQLGISYFPSLQIFVPDAESNVGLYKLTENLIPSNNYYILRLGDVGLYPWVNETNTTYLFYSETCQYSALQREIFTDISFNYTPVCIPIHTGDADKCKEVWGNDKYLEFERINSVYKIRETPTLLVNSKYMLVGYHSKEQFNAIIDSLKKV